MEILENIIEIGYVLINKRSVYFNYSNVNADTYYIFQRGEEKIYFGLFGAMHVQMTISIGYDKGYMTSNIPKTKQELQDIILKVKNGELKFKSHLPLERADEQGTIYMNVLHPELGGMNFEHYKNKVGGYQNNIWNF